MHVSDPNLQAELVPLARYGGQVWYDLKVHLSPTAPAGYISDRAVLTTNDPSMGQIPVQVEGQVRPNVAVNPCRPVPGRDAHRAESHETACCAGRPTVPHQGYHGRQDIVRDPGTAERLELVHVVPVTFIAGAEVGKVVKTIHIDTDIGGAQATSYAVVNEADNK